MADTPSAPVETGGEPLFEVAADGVDVEALMARIRADVEEKRRQGLYVDVHVGRAERHNLANIKDEDEFLTFYLECLRDAVFVDISDFEILEKRARFTRLLVVLKRAIWKLLKFYTYRLWSQQNQVNGLLLSSVEALEERSRKRTAALEARIAELERRLADGKDA